MSDEEIPPIIDTQSLAQSIDWDGEKLDDDGTIGAEVIKRLVKRLPSHPGVYRMFNGDGDVLYVGKAKNLKKRVTNYALGRGHTNRITRMISLTAAMEFVVTRSETEALLLEANLIKRLRPRFNVLMRDDKSFPYIMISRNHSSPGLFKHRGARSRKGDYFGPFANASAVTRTIDVLQRAFLLRNCTDSSFESRTRPCLLHQIKRCAGPCTGEVSAQEYDALVNETKDFLSGRSMHVKTQMAQAMEKASQELDFERAAIYRDRITALSHVQGHQGINPQSVDEADVFAIHQDGGQNCIEVFFFRTGQNWGNRAYFPKADSSLDARDVLAAFLAQFYDDKPCPGTVLLSHEVEEQELLSDALSIRAGRKVSVSHPKRGEKKDMVDRAAQNAREALGRRLSETSTQKRLMESLAKSFDLETVPKRIEVYDNSHIMGTSAIGAMIVAGQEGFLKNQYRKFNIKNPDTAPGDDFAMMREVMERRFARLIKEHGIPDNEKTNTEIKTSDDNDAIDAQNETDANETPIWPDLLLIDGGKGQMKVVHETLGALGLDKHIVAIGVAKGPDRDAGRERFHVKGKTDFSLPPRDPVLYFVQRLRDEAHRFAIGTHRTKRKNEMMKNPLDEIAKIGPSRKRALLHHFGSAKAVSNAPLEDLLAVEGISAHIAQLIYDHFHEKS